MEVGQVTIMAVETILTWSSCDGGGPEQYDSAHTYWDHYLYEKRQDAHYEDVVNSIREHGFIRPLTATIKDGKPHFVDGHHRLAAAIDLGMTHVLIELFEDFWPSIARDSGSWNKSRPIPKEHRS